MRERVRVDRAAALALDVVVADPVRRDRIVIGLLLTDLVTLGHDEGEPYLRLARTASAFPSLNAPGLKVAQTPPPPTPRPRPRINYSIPWRKSAARFLTDRPETP